ncbi:MAG TPA: glycoside hydrolase family 3 N-terminal domain-containing protein, partial [Gemmatimonadales bacterium]|nr:glycoside hydrolase family 3 N-terminal domain-containing protein [Gemmatimonadales bacterium]
MLVGLVLAGACAPSAPRLAPAPQPAAVPDLPAVELPPAVVEARAGHLDLDAVVRALTVRQKLAQLLMPWVPGSYAAFDDSTFVRAAHWVDSLQLGGIIIAGGSPIDIAVKLNHLQRRSALPLLIGADLEGGSAFRFNGGTPFPTNMGIAAGGTELDAYEVGRVTALEGRAVGVHLAFAPVADVNNNPANPIINTRSFGEDPARVGALVGATVRGIQEHGMLATVKHFPGHGDTGTDSHIALPVIPYGWPRLDSIELVPFRAAIRAGVGAVMSAHIALPGIDGGSDRAASLSPAIVTGVLRDSLDFHGIVVTDALNMGGVSTDGGASAAVRALLAGADLLLQPQDPRAALDSLEQAYRDGRITDERIDLSLRRVLKLKEQLGLFRERTVDVEAIPLTVGRQEFRNEAADLMRRAIVLARDAGGAVDSLRRGGRRSVTLITYGDENSATVGTTLTTELRANGFSVSVFKLWGPSGAASYDSARVALARNGMPIFVASVRTSAWRGTLALPEAYAALADSVAKLRPTILVSLGSPYIVSQVPNVGSYLVA